MRCPGCGSPDLDPAQHDAAGMTTCRCGLRAYAGYLAEADALDARRGWLADRIAAGDPAPEPALARSYGVWPPPVAGSLPGQVGTHPAGVRAAGSRPAPSAQTILLGVGALLLVVAGAVFAAVVWDRLGAAGQVALMLGATVGVGALAVRLRSRLEGTAEALAVVAAGLAAIDLVAAPLLGLVPERWLSEPTLYPALALAGLGLGLLLLHARSGLRAWSWLGWLAIPVAAGCVVPAVAAMTDSPAWTAAAATVPAVASVALLAAPTRSPRLRDQRAPLHVAGALGLAASAWGTAVAATIRPALPGALLTTAVSALAVGVWAGSERREARRTSEGDTPVAPGPGSPQGPVRVPHGRARLLSLATAALAGIALGMALAIPAEPQPAWLAALVAVAGLGVGTVALVSTDETEPAVVGAIAVWSSWAGLRVVSFDPVPGGADPQAQLSLLAGLVALIGFVAAAWLPWAGWIAAGLGLVALGLAPWDQPDAVEAYSLPAAALLLLAGVLWRRSRPCPSLAWLGPAVAAALIPSALACWIAPWALGGGQAGGHLVRLGLVLATSLAAVVAGARWRLGGLLLPGAAALVIAALAQVYSGLANLPRWIGLGIAGTLLIVAGARIEALRREGRRAAGWVGDLR